MLDRDILPEPEVLSLDSVPLLDTKTGGSPPIETKHRSRPVERINGVFLDTLQPESATLGWGSLQRNKSVWEKPITIAGRQFRRGLGAHAPSVIKYALDGKYRRFQSWVGADGATAPTITFEVCVDGQKRWESGLMQRDTAAKQVDVDVTNAKTLEMVVGDGGNGNTSDHADWADARLLH